MKHIQHKPVIGITMGDAVGIGPEILVKTLSESDIFKFCKPVVIGDAQIIQHALNLLKIDMTINIIHTVGQGQFEPGGLDVLSVSNLDDPCAKLSAPTVQTGVAMQNYIIKGIDLALQNKIDALVTCPITKTAMKLAQSKFHGHTELLAHNTQTDEYAMMLSGNQLKVILVTIHIPLAEVSKHLSIDEIVKKIRLTQTSLIERFDIKKPRIAVAGLNPHAGEASMFGKEEEEIITPAVTCAQKEK